MNGSYTPRTLPVGGEEAREVSPRSLAETALVKTLFLIICKSVIVHSCALLENTTETATMGFR